jgi:hypothetical protein
MVGKPVQENQGETDMIGSNSISTPSLMGGEPIQANQGETDVIDSNLISTPTLMVGEPVQENQGEMATSRDDEASAKEDVAPAPVQFCGPPPTGRVRRVPYSSSKPPLYPRKNAARHPAANVGRKRKGQEEEGTGPCKKRRRLLDKPPIPLSSPCITLPVDEEGLTDMSTRMKHPSNVLVTESSNVALAEEEDDDVGPLFGERLVEDFDAGDDDFGVDGSDFYFIEYEAESSNVSGGLNNKDECGEDFSLVGEDSAMELDTGSAFGVGFGVGSAPTLVDEPGDQESSNEQELLGTIWVAHRDYGFVRRSARLAVSRTSSRTLR